jgi:hypothetical protein
MNLAKVHLATWNDGKLEWLWKMLRIVKLFWYLKQSSDLQMHIGSCPIIIHMISTVNSDIKGATSIRLK